MTRTDVDPLAEARERERQQVVGEPGVDARGEARDAAASHAVLERPTHRRCACGGKTSGTTEVETTLIPDATMRPCRRSLPPAAGHRSPCNTAVGVAARAASANRWSRGRRWASRPTARRRRAGLVLGVHDHAGELEIRVLDDQSQGEPPDVARAPLDDLVRHGPPLRSRGPERRWTDGYVESGRALRRRER